MRALIVGCGYVGVPLGAELARLGHEVHGFNRSAARDEELARAGVRPLRGDVTQPADLAALPGPYDWIVNTVSASGSSEEDYQRAYLDGARCLLQWLKGASLAKYVYTSSTGVYGQQDGSVVKEDSATEPGTPTGRVLVATEQALLEAAREWRFPAVILRVAGIYGPGRGYWLKQYLKNEARIEGAGDRVLNMIHREDVAGCIVAALRNGRRGEVYNAVDDEPVTQLHYFQWLAAALGKWLPPSVPASEAGSGRPRNNKRISNRKLKMELGYRFKYPTFREGYTAELARMEAAGELEIKPEAR